MTTTRLEALSDGVFAVAITLLVFNLVVPTVGHASLWHALLGQWPSYAAYVVSFLIIGIIWVNHHALFRNVARVDRPVLFLNLVVLMTIVFIPFASRLLAAYLLSGSNSHIAAAVYSGTMLAMSISIAVLWAYIVFHPDLLEDASDPSSARSSIPRFSAGIAVYAATIGIAFISAALCLGIHALIALYYAFDQVSSADQAGNPIPSVEGGIEEK